MDKHHIVPKHMGGMEEPWNIMELSREDHIWAHKILYKLYGNVNDKRAVLLLEGQWPDQSGENNPRYSVTNTPEHRKKISDTKRAKGVSMKYSAVYYRERYDTGKKRGQRDQRGEKNSMYGRTRTDSKQN
ncbi:MAG: HNH endonuclease signature motif containing protein, partial [Anaerolineales bacterium]|nr:HNH endonuclease signature motif containing protein [Anaerolineales bacterium]